VAHKGLAISGGASGAIFGIYGALLVFLWCERGRLHPREFRWFFWGAMAFAMVSLGLGLAITGIDNAAHIGGFLTGLLSGIIFADPATAAINRKASPVFGRGRLAAISILALSVFTLIVRIPPPAYKWSEEVLARKEIGNFLRDDLAITQAWQHILDEARRGGISFDELAGQIDTAVGNPYEESFEQLSELPPDPALPSAATIEMLRHYAERRRDASRALAEGLRTHNPGQIRHALEMARQPPQLPRLSSPTPPPLPH
jgi:rhomboid protease GluP